VVVVFIPNLWDVLILLFVVVVEVKVGKLVDVVLRAILVVVN
jgi:hypothetical protein